MTKTGSTSIETVIAPECDILFTGNPRVKHMQFRKYERFIKPYLKSLGHTNVETVCLFREPLDWLGSWYRYRSREKLRGHQNSTSNVSFSNFVESYLSDHPKSFADVGRQSKFVMGKDGITGVNRLFDYDKFEIFEEFLSDRFGKKFNIPKLNSSQSEELYLKQSIKRRLEIELSRDYEIYNTINR